MIYMCIQNKTSIGLFGEKTTNRRISDYVVTLNCFLKKKHLETKQYGLLLKKLFIWLANFTHKEQNFS